MPHEIYVIIISKLSMTLQSNALTTQCVMMIFSVSNGLVKSYRFTKEFKGTHVIRLCVYLSTFDSQLSSCQ